MPKRNSNAARRRRNDEIARQRWAVKMARMLPAAEPAEVGALQADLRMIGAVL